MILDVVLDFAFAGMKVLDFVIASLYLSADKFCQVQ